MIPAISIIIPVYNAEKYLYNCVDSILMQDFLDYEVILVNDGSTDDSAAICQDFAKQKNVTFVSKKNGGPNSARAYGLSYASGEWVSFVDSDDMLLPNSLRDLYSATGTARDIIVGFSFESTEEEHTLPIQKWREALIKSDIILCTPWGKLFRRSILSEFCFHTLNKDVMGEDMIMNIRIAYSTNNDVCIIKPRVYCYNDRAGSVSKTAKWSLGNLSESFDEIKRSIPESEYEKVITQLIENRVIALENKMRISSVFDRERHLNASCYLDVLKRDISESGYKLAFKRYFLINHTDSLFTILLYKFAWRLLVLKEFLQRKLHLNRR